MGSVKSNVPEPRAELVKSSRPSPSSRPHHWSPSAWLATSRLLVVFVPLRPYGQKGDRKGLVSDQEVLPSCPCDLSHPTNSFETPSKEGSYYGNPIERWIRRR